MRITAFCLVALFGGTLAQGVDQLRTDDGSLDRKCRKCKSWMKFGEDAWLYGFAPLWVYKKHHDQTQKTKGETVYAPENCLYVSEKLPDANTQPFVSPNPNVVYASAHLNLTTTSVRLFVKPNPDNQYYIWQTMDAFTNSRPEWYIGSTNIPNKNQPHEGNFAFVYQGCKGANCSVPHERDEHITIISTDEPIIWVMARYYVTKDENAQETRDALLESTLGVTYGYDASKGNPGNYTNHGPFQPAMPIDSEPIGALDLLNEWISQNGYGQIDSSNKMEFENCGLKPNSNVKFAQLGTKTKNEILVGIKTAKYKIKAAGFFCSASCQNWRWFKPNDVGIYGTDFLMRSDVARVGLGANIPAIAIYKLSRYTRGGQAVEANSTYSVTLPKVWVDDPPFNEPGYWSISVYNLSTGTLLNTKADNITNVHYPSDGIVKNKSGEVVIWVSAKKPDISEVNWLPLPENNSGNIYLMLRIYGTKQSAIQAKCTTPRLGKSFDELQLTPDYSVPRLVKERRS